MNMDAPQYPVAMPLTAFYPGGHAPIMPPPPPDLFQPRLHHLHTFALDNIGSFPEQSDPNQTMSASSQGSQRVRRKQSATGEHVKHRRTRSGCYTCRQRRVKCDEKRPTCDRCRKGKRECAYPETSSTSSSRGSRREGKAKSATGESGSSPSGDEEDADEADRLPAIPDDDAEFDVDDEEPQSAASVNTNASTWSQGRTASQFNVLPSVSQRPARPQASRTSSRQAISSAIIQHPRWSSLSKEDRTFLTYHREKLSYHHYAFKFDGNDFLRTTFLEIALNDQSQALVFAIIAFSAYHRSIERQDFKISTFLTYYNKSIVLLHQALSANKKPGIATLLTILQLATIEEFLGDWSNLLGHQRAAHQILIDLFTPQTIMQDETRRRIIAWYIRFDLFAGMMSGSETRLGREWFAACHDHYKAQAQDRPDDLGARFEDYFATSRLRATDVALLFAGKVGGKISDEDFAASVQDLLRKFQTFGRMLEDAFTDPASYVKDFPGAPPPGNKDEITNFRDPYFLRTGELFTMNFVLLDFWAIDLMFKYNVTKVHGTAPTSELTSIALKTCKMFEAIQYSQAGPPGAIIGCQASLGIASLFLPKDEKHTSWCRQKYATIERLGYIYPLQLRKQLSDAWGVDVTEWWFPNNEGYPDILRAVREFIDYRSEVPRDTMDKHLRDMSGLFRSMNVDEQSSSPSSESKALSPGMSQTLSFESSPEQFQG